MKVKLVDDTTPRSDNRKGKPTDVTLDKVYEVVEILESQYSIINDRNKIARYSHHRFEVVEVSELKPLRNAFNELTFDMRMELKELRESKQTASEAACDALEALLERLEKTHFDNAPSTEVMAQHVSYAIKLEKNKHTPMNLQGSDDGNS
mgnify:CR=1 FL=1